MIRAVLSAFCLLLQALPALAGDAVHQARPGDHPAALAKRYHVTLAAILARNPGLDPCRIMVGDVIVIPDAATLGAPSPAVAAPPAKAAPGPATATPAKTEAPTGAKADSALLPDEEAAGRKYVVAPGDCPAVIAERFGIPLEVLEKANPGLDAKRLPVGCVLAVPDAAACAPPPVAVARPGEPASAAPLVMDLK
jgi:LysM repeat protein